MYGEPMESWINVFDIYVRGQNDMACQKVISAINTRDTRCVEERRVKTDSSEALGAPA